MLLEDFKTAYSKVRTEPKGIRIGYALWKELKDANLIKTRSVAVFGVFDLGEEMPFYKDSILLIDPELELLGLSFRFPQNATNPSSTKTSP